MGKGRGRDQGWKQWLTGTQIKLGRGRAKGGREGRDLRRARWEGTEPWKSKREHVVLREKL